MSTHETAQIACIGVEPAYRPGWFREDAGTHVPLPPPTVASPATHLPGVVVAWADAAEGRVPLVSVEAGRGRLRYDWTRWRQFVLGERYRTQTRPLYTRLPFHYHRIPGAIRSVAARALLARHAPVTQAGTTFPGFPIEQGFELLAYVWERVGGEATSASATTEVILTHDIDTRAGFAWVEPTAELELAHGFRSLWHVVGRGDRRDHAVLDWLVARGCTVGLHGYNHDNRLAFLPADRIRRRLDACRDLIARYDIRSFRSPSWFRSDTLFGVLRDYGMVDYSRLDTDRSCRAAPAAACGRNGSCWTT